MTQHVLLFDKSLSVSVFRGTAKHLRHFNSRLTIKRNGTVTTINFLTGNSRYLEIVAVESYVIKLKLKFPIFFRMTKFWTNPITKGFLIYLIYEKGSSLIGFLQVQRAHPNYSIPRTRIVPSTSNHPKTLHRINCVILTSFLSILKVITCESKRYRDAYGSYP